MKVLAGLLIILIVISSISYAQDNDVSKAIEDANMDAQQNISNIWFPIGCFFGIWGIGAAYYLTPTPPTQRFIGQSPEYIQAYSNEYKKVMRQKQAHKALSGCITGAFLTVLAFIISNQRDF